MKILCVMLPHFPWRCEVRRHPDIEGRAATVTYTEGSQRLVLDHSPWLEVLTRGMSLQQALARHGEAELLHADVPYYRGVFNEILDKLEQKSPLVEGAEAGCIYIGADGLQLIYADDNALANAVREVVAELRPRFNGGFCTSRDIEKLSDGAFIKAAGLVIRRQRPRGKVVFITLEDEFGHIPCMVFGKVSGTSIRSGRRS